MWAPARPRPRRLGAALRREGIAVTTVGSATASTRTSLTALAQRSDATTTTWRERRPAAYLRQGSWATCSTSWPARGDHDRVPEGVRVIRSIGRGPSGPTATAASGSTSSTGGRRSF
jgi:hypothetical protein